MLNKRELNFIDARLGLELDELQVACPTAYLPPFLLQATLPHAKPKGTHFERGSSRLKLSIVANAKFGLPYGMMPRLLLAWICTEACRTQSQHLDLGKAQSHFLKQLKLPSDGRYIKALHTQILALLWSQISVAVSGSGSLSFENLYIAKNKNDFLNSAHPDGRFLWNSSLRLSDEFYDVLIKSAVPLKIEALHALRQSPMAMDLYAWLVYRIFRLNAGVRMNARPFTNIPWQDLMCQFGSHYPDSAQGIRNFKFNFLIRLKEALVFYPEAREYVEENPKHLVLRAGAKRHVSPRLGSDFPGFYVDKPVC